MKYLILTLLGFFCLNSFSAPSCNFNNKKNCDVKCKCEIKWKGNILTSFLINREYVNNMKDAKKECHNVCNDHKGSHYATAQKVFYDKAKGQYCAAPGFNNHIKLELELKTSASYTHQNNFKNVKSKKFKDHTLKYPEGKIDCSRDGAKLVAGRCVINSPSGERLFIKNKAIYKLQEGQCEKPFWQTSGQKDFCDGNYKGGSVKFDSADNVNVKALSTNTRKAHLFVWNKQLWRRRPKKSSEKDQQIFWKNLPVKANDAKVKNSTSVSYKPTAVCD